MQAQAQSSCRTVRDGQFLSYSVLLISQGQVFRQAKPAALRYCLEASKVAEIGGIVPQPFARSSKQMLAMRSGFDATALCKSKVMWGKWGKSDLGYRLQTQQDGVTKGPITELMHSLRTSASLCFPLLRLCDPCAEGCRPRVARRRWRARELL